MIRTLPGAIALTLVCALGLTSCDSLTETAYMADETATASRVPAGDRSGRPLMPVTAGAFSEAAACPCFSAAALAAPVHGAVPAPHLLFDTFNFWNEDYRRTEVRATVAVGGGTYEEVGAVYIPRGIPALPLPVMCFRQDVHEDGDDWAVSYRTVEVSVAEAEACRQEAYAFADGLPCQGGACGLPYTADQLDPNYPEYDADWRRSLPFLHALDLRRAAVDPSVSRFAQ